MVQRDWHYKNASNKNDMQSSTIQYPSAILSNYIKYYWIIKTGDADKMTIQTIPSGCMHLVFHRGKRIRYISGSKQPATFLRGQLSLPGNIFSPGNIDMIAVIFQPLGFSFFFSLPTTLFYNEYIDVEAMEDKGLNELNTFLVNEENAMMCIEHIEQFLIDRLHNENNNMRRVQNALHKIVVTETVSIELLADSAYLGYRQFKRIFEQYVGVNPKEYCRIIRFQRVLYFLQHNPDVEISRLAYECGYFDHSHLIKEFREFTGYAPVEYISTHLPYSTFFSRDCRLNLIKNSKKK